MEEEPRVAIILINYNSLKHTIECVISLNRQKYSNYQIIVIDNASEKDDIKILQTHPNVILFKNTYNSGFSTANNMGIKLAINNHAKFVWLLNNDTVVDENCLGIMLQAYRDVPKKNKIGVITGKILMYYEKNKIWYSGGNINCKKGSADINGLGKKDNTSYHKCEIGEFDFASGCSMLLPIQAIRQIGLMSEDYFLYYEDTDYCIRIKSLGLKIVYCDCAKLYHKEGSSTKKRSGLYTYYFTRNRLLFIKNNISGTNKIIAYIYSILWFTKKGYEKEFDWKFIRLGVNDFLSGKIGKSNYFQVER